MIETNIIAAIYSVDTVVVSCIDSIIAVIPHVAALSAVYTCIVVTSGSLIAHTIIISAG